MEELPWEVCWFAQLGGQLKGFGRVCIQRKGSSWEVAIEKLNSMNEIMRSRTEKHFDFLPLPSISPRSK
jgi:hypothetical protein